MADTAKVFTNGRSQAVRLPLAYRFKADEVSIRRDPQTGEVVLSEKPTDWSGLFALLKSEPAARDFLNKKERAQKLQKRDPLKGIKS